MAFFEEQFPPCISIGMTGGPRFLTSKVYANNGRRITNLGDELPLHQFSLSKPIQAEEDFDLLRAFFWNVSGDTDGFRFKDWSDYRATAQNSRVTLVSGTTYQLNRIYIFGNRTKVRPIQKPITGSQIFRVRGGVATDITGTDAGTVNTTTGRVTILNNVGGDTYFWVGQFDLPAAFVDPAAVFNIIGGPRMLSEWASIEIEEIRV